MYLSNCYIYLSNLLHVFVKVVTCICLSWYMYLTKLLHVFVKVVVCICQICYMYLSKLLHYSWSLRLVGSSRSVGLAADPVAAHIPNQPLHPHGFIIIIVIVVIINIIIDTIISSSIVIINIQWNRTLQTNRSFHMTSSSLCYCRQTCKDGE